jgi:hypothetical protein
MSCYPTLALRTRRRRLVAALVSVALATLAAPPLAAADHGAFLSQDGPETQLTLVSGCFSAPTPDGQGASTVCADGPAQPGPRVPLHAGSAALRFEVAVNEVVVQLAAPGQPSRPLSVTRTDDTRWDVELPAPLASDAQVTVFVRGGSAAGRDVWDAFCVATVDAPKAAPPITTQAQPPAAPRSSIRKLRADGRRITASIGADAARSATFVAYVQLDGRQVSTRVTGKLTSSRRLVLTLRRGSWRHARRHGRLVVRVTTAGGVHVQRLRLPR